jgi:hypothetical protein
MACDSGYVPPSLLEMDEEIRRRAAADMALAARVIDPTKFHRRSMVDIHHPRPGLLTRLSQVFADAPSGPPSRLASPRASLDMPPSPPSPVGPATVAPRASGAGLGPRTSIFGLLTRGSVKGLPVFGSLSKGSTASAKGLPTGGGGAISTGASVKGVSGLGSVATGPLAGDAGAGPAAAVGLPGQPRPSPVPESPFAGDNAQADAPSSVVPAVGPARQPSPAPGTPFAGDNAQAGGPPGALADTPIDGLAARSTDAQRVATPVASERVGGGMDGRAHATKRVVDDAAQRPPQHRSWASR